MEKTVCELFAGVGGFRVGLEKAGNWKTVWANQWEPNKTKQHAFDCYIQRFGDSKCHVNEDISKVSTDDIPEHTLLVGGFPCQDYSVARTKATGIEGKKGVLFWEITRLIKEKKPPFVLLENVDRLLKSPASQRGRDFGIMLASLNELGYGVEWRVINAAEYGFAQRRRRAFIFAFRKTTNYYQQALSELLTKQSFEETATDYLHNKSFFQDEFKVKERDINSKRFEQKTLQGDLVEISDGFKMQFWNTGIMINGEIFTEETHPVETEATPLRAILDTNVTDEWFYLEGDMSEWKTMKGAKKIERTSKTGHKYFYTEGNMAFPDDLDSPARTMLTSESSKNRSTHVVRDPQNGKLRLLTPEECEKLNGFEPGWTDTGMPRKFRYFCMGNALVTGLVEKMGFTLNRIVENEVEFEQYGLEDFMPELAKI